MHHATHQVSDESISEMLKAAAVVPTNQDSCISEEDYQGIFAKQGLRNAERLLQALADSNWDADPDQCCIVSVGGADGSELEHLLRKGVATKAVLVEMSGLGCGLARTRLERLAAEQPGITWLVAQGDVTEQLDCVEQFLVGLRDRGCKSIILSFQAVLHELPRRSPNYCRQLVLERLLYLFEHRLVYCCEPSTAKNWPKLVELRVPGVSPHQLTKVAEFLRDRLRFSAEAVLPAGRYVRMGSDLALEVLHKVLRSVDAREFVYECGEQLTSFDAGEYAGFLQRSFGLGVSVERKTSGSFASAYRRFNVHARCMLGETLDVPNSHSIVIAATPRQAAITAAPAPSWSPAPMPAGKHGT
ncbi:hypothetical protein [Arenimonas sp.]|uniref:hypothetical protein n=1 Tax=Arenimonas sp. TaxID=1872635 RepID=UPI0025E952F5|nr:hypothetical protein [Arenimonas sp.]